MQVLRPKQASDSMLLLPQGSQNRVIEPLSEWQPSESSVLEAYSPNKTNQNKDKKEARP